MAVYTFYSFLLELTLPVHKAPISDAVFFAPLALRNVRLSVDAFRHGPAPLFISDFCKFLIHQLTSFKYSFITAVTIIEGGIIKYKTH